MSNFVAGKSRIRLCQPGTRKSEIVDVSREGSTLTRHEMDRWAHTTHICQHDRFEHYVMRQTLYPASDFFVSNTADGHATRGERSPQEKRERARASEKQK